MAEHIGVKVIKFTSWGTGGNVYKFTLNYTEITKITIAATFLTGDRTGSIVDIVLSRGQYGLKAGLSNSVDGSNDYIRVLLHESALYIKAEDYVYGCISMDCVVNCEKVAVSDIPNDALVLL